MADDVLDGRVGAEAAGAEPAGAEPAGAGPAWTVLGPVGAPLVVLIHPTRLNRTFWTPQVEALAPTMRVLAVDLPGHGRLEQERFRLAGAVAAVRAAIESEAGSCPGAPRVIVGLSLGGYVAMALAAEEPSIADALVVAGATAEPAGLFAHPFRALAIAYERAVPARVSWVDSSIFRRRYPGLGDRIVESGLAYRGGSEALKSLAGESFLPRLAAYPGPVVLVNGSGDVAMRAGERRFLAAAQHGRVVHLPGAFHLSSLDRPQQFTAIIRRVVGAAVEVRRAIRSGAAADR